MLEIVAFAASGMNLLVPFGVGVITSLFLLVSQSANLRTVASHGVAAGITSGSIRTEKEASRLKLLGHSVYVMRLTGFVSFAKTQASADL